MAKRILNRKDLRADYDAAERRRAGEERGEDEEEVETDEEEEEAEAEEEAGDQEEEEEEAAPKKRKAPAKAAKPKTRTRTSKVARLKVVWGVFNNSNQRVATYEYPQRKQADEHAAKLMTDKRSTHFVQPVKEPFEVKKDD